LNLRFWIGERVAKRRYLAGNLVVVQFAVQSERCQTARKGNRCFYCLQALDSSNDVIEHVVSRPEGDSTYRNVVAACRDCNNRKGEMSAEDFIRSLYRGGYFYAQEFESRLARLQLLKNGELKPDLIATKK